MKLVQREPILAYLVISDKYFAFELTFHFNLYVYKLAPGGQIESTAVVQAEGEVINNLTLRWLLGKGEGIFY